MVRRLSGFLIFAIATTSAWAGATRTIDADALTSSDRTKTFTLPSQTGTVVGSGNLKQEAPSGTVNGSNTAFTLSTTPINNASVQLYLDGMILVQGTDYTISGASITMTTAPETSQTLYAVYVRN